MRHGILGLGFEGESLRFQVPGPTAQAPKDSET